MNKKPTGLIRTIEIPACLAKRETRDAIIDNWAKENPDCVRDMKKLTKDQLIHRLIRAEVATIYDKVLAKFQNETALEMRKLHKAVLPTVINHFLKATSDEERRLWLARLEAVKISIAGNNIHKVADIAHAAGAATVRIDERPKIKAFKDRNVNLAKGRKDGVKKRQETAAEKQDRLNKAIEALFDTPEKPGWGWTNPEIVEFLMKSKYGYAESGILQAVKIEAAKHRKAKKEQLASKYLNR